MPNTTENALTKSYRGKFGDDFVMRTRDGLSIIAKPPRRRKRIATDIQEEIRDNFKNANKWSKDLANKPDMLAEYTGRANGMMTAHVLAVTDYLKPPRVKAIVTADYRGNVGDVIRVKAKDDFKVASVAVKITAPNGDLLEEGPCAQDANYEFWSYTATTNIPDLTDVTITATAKDNPEHYGWMELTL